MAFMQVSIWIRGARLKTLPLAIAPVVIGAALTGATICETIIFTRGGKADGPVGRQPAGAIHV
ncbi:MAG TPA: hypothetical protein DCO66_02470 [Bifidobacterium sp.]|nr:hypothetical protein [Bifidobacterium sp.]